MLRKPIPVISVGDWVERDWRTERCFAVVSSAVSLRSRDTVLDARNSQARRNILIRFRETRLFTSSPLACSKKQREAKAAPCLSVPCAARQVLRRFLR